MDATIHAEAIKRNSQKFPTAPSKAERFRLTWPQAERTAFRARDGHAAILVQRWQRRRLAG